jgi:hypothetical protein
VRSLGDRARGRERWLVDDVTVSFDQRTAALEWQGEASNKVEVDETWQRPVVNGKLIDPQGNLTELIEQSRTVDLSSGVAGRDSESPGRETEDKPVSWVAPPALGPSGRPIDDPRLATEKAFGVRPGERRDRAVTDAGQTATSTTARQIQRQRTGREGQGP